MRGLFIGLRGLAIGGDDVEDQTVAGVNRVTRRDRTRFTAALTRCNCDSFGQDAVRIWSKGELDDIGNGERPLRYRMRLAVHENCREVAPNGRIVPKVCF